MPAAQQLDLPADPTYIYGDQAADAALLRCRLALCGWQTRRQLCEALGWSERQVRETAEALGADVVRGQAGFKLTETIGRNELSLALQSADASISQGKIMIRYGLALKRRLHAILG